MPRACSTCLHPDLDAIDAALASGESPKTVAARFHASPQSIQRHASNHLPAAIAKSPRIDSVVKADGLLDRVEALYADAKRILTKAEAGVERTVQRKDGTLDTVVESDLRAATSAIREARGCVELLAKLVGELQPEGATVNVLVASPEWASTQRRVLDALRPFPEAKAAVVQALQADPALAA